MNNTWVKLTRFCRNLMNLKRLWKHTLEKVDPVLIVDFLLHQKDRKNSNKNPIYTLEVFIKPNQNTDEIRNRIIKETGMVPACKLNLQASLSRTIMEDGMIWCFFMPGCYAYACFDYCFFNYDLNSDRLLDITILIRYNAIKPWIWYTLMEYLFDTYS